MLHHPVPVLHTLKQRLTVADVLAVVLLAVLACALMINPLHAVISDFWYHLGVSRALMTSGTIPSHDWWSFQPLGRPHFYPPLIHLLIAFASGGSIQNLLSNSYFLGSALYVGNLAAAWFFYRHFWGSAVALFGLGALTTVLIFTLTATSLMPAAIISMLLPVYLVALERKIFPLAVALLALSFYTHLSFSWLMVLGTAALMLQPKHFDRRWLVRVIASAMLLALPWLVRIAVAALSFQFTEVLTAQSPLHGIGPFAIFSHYMINVFGALLVISGLWVTRNDRSRGIEMTRLFLVALLPMLLLYGGRYFWHTVPLLAVFAVVPFKKYIDRCFNPFTWHKAFALLLCSVFLIVPTIGLSVNAKQDSKPHIDPEFTALDLAIMRTRNLTDEEDFKSMAAFLEEHTTSEDILAVEDPDIADILFVTTGRRTNNGQFWESAVGTTPAQENDLYAASVYRTEEFKDTTAGTHRFGEYTVVLPLK